MSPEELKQFNEADKVVHTVESEWHYPMMTKYGYIPLDKTGIGFVRSYKYVHPVTKDVVRMCTGVSADYWEADSDNGLWHTSEKYLQKMTV